MVRLVLQYMEKSKDKTMLVATSFSGLLASRNRDASVT